MTLRALIVAATLLPWLAAAPLQAADQPATPAAQDQEPANLIPCIDVIMPTAGQQPFAPIMFNRCTGQSWILAKHALSPIPVGKPGATYAYRWYPIVTAPAESQLPDPAPSMYAYPEIPGK